MKRTVRYKCGHEGCTEFALFEADNRSHAISLDKRYGNGQWRCSRHSMPDEVLSLDSPKKSAVLKVFKEPHGLYWGTDKAFSGFVFGPGFKAFADDFPEGTTIEITAKINIPS